MSANPAFLSWIDLTASDRDKVRRALDLFEEQDTIDKLGLGPFTIFSLTPCFRVPLSCMFCFLG